MNTSFYIKEKRLEELKSFIRNNTPTARFKNNPIKEGKEYHISLELDVEDGNKLTKLQNKWYYEDNPKETPISFYLKVKNFFRNFI